jgi:hypothetical protein
LILIIVFLAVALAGGAAFVITQQGNSGGGRGDGTGDAVAVVPQADLEPEVEEAPAWSGLVAEMYSGDPSQTASPGELAQQLQHIDHSAQLNLRAQTMLQQAILTQAIGAEHRDAATQEYTRITANLIHVLVELDLCDGANRRLASAFALSQLVPRNASPINTMRASIRVCRTEQETHTVEWNQRDYGELVEQGRQLYEQALAIPPDQPEERTRVLFESVVKRQDAAHMLIQGLSSESIPRRQLQGAQGDLFELTRHIVLSHIELGLRLAAEVHLEEGLDLSSLLPEASIPELQELQLLVAAENERAAEALGLPDEADPDAPWSWANHQTIVTLAADNFARTRVGYVAEQEAPEQTEESGAGTGQGTGAAP